MITDSRNERACVSGGFSASVARPFCGGVHGNHESLRCSQLGIHGIQVTVLSATQDAHGGSSQVQLGNNHAIDDGVALNAGHPVHQTLNFNVTVEQVHVNLVDLLGQRHAAEEGLRLGRCGEAVDHGFFGETAIGGRVVRHTGNVGRATKVGQIRLEQIRGTDSSHMKTP